MKLSNFMEVESALLHQATYIEGYCTSEKTLNNTKLKNIKMTVEPQGLHLQMIDQRTKKPIDQVIPIQSVMSYKLKQVEEK